MPDQPGQRLRRLVEGSGRRPLVVTIVVVALLTIVLALTGGERGDDDVARAQLTQAHAAIARDDLRTASELVALARANDPGSDDLVAVARALEELRGTAANYDRAERLADEEQYEEAFTLMQALGDFHDARARALELRGLAVDALLDESDYRLIVEPQQALELAERADELAPSARTRAAIRAAARESG